MEKLDFNSYLVSELSKLLFNGDYLVIYVYRHHNKPSILIQCPSSFDDSNKHNVLLNSLEEICLHSRGLVSFERLNFVQKGFVYSHDELITSSVTYVVYELTFLNNSVFECIVKKSDKYIN